jgi:hypothetical protein
VEEGHPEEAVVAEAVEAGREGWLFQKNYVRVRPIMNETRLQAIKAFVIQKLAAAEKTAGSALEVFSLLSEEFQVEDEDVLMAGMLLRLVDEVIVTEEEIEEVVSKRALEILRELKAAKSAPNKGKDVVLSAGAKLVKLADHLRELRGYFRVIRAEKVFEHPVLKDPKQRMTAIREFLDECKDLYPLEVSTVYLAMYEVEKGLKVVPDIESFS